MPVPRTTPTLEISDAIEALSLPPSVVKDAVECLETEAREPPWQSGNNQAWPKCRPMTTGQLVVPNWFDFAGVTKDAGHCKYLVTRTRVNGQQWVETPKLHEGGTDLHPRVTINRRKYYVYHLLAVYQAHMKPGKFLNPGLLARVSQRKAGAEAYTILHDCGHKWCVNRSHLSIGPKTFNDEQVSCHRGLLGALDRTEYQGVQKYYCKHDPKCWTIRYTGEYSDAPRWTRK